MVIERKVVIINLFEIKHYNSPYCLDSKDIESFCQKKNDFAEATKTKFAIHLSMIALKGAEENAYSLELQSIVSADDLSD